MEIGNQIKRYRKESRKTQEELAEEIYVSRQSISNWENNKNYPDLNSLIRLSEVFQVSIDHLIKGDWEKMKKEISQADQKDFDKLSTIYVVLLGLTMFTPVPLSYFLGKIGTIIWGLLFTVSFYTALRVEKMKKTFDIQTYKEIIAFSEGDSLDEISKAKEEGKRNYQKAFLAILTALITGVFAFTIYYILTKFF